MEGKGVQQDHFAPALRLLLRRWGHGCSQRCINPICYVALWTSTIAGCGFDGLLDTFSNSFMSSRCCFVNDLERFACWLCGGVDMPSFAVCAAGSCILPRLLSGALSSGGLAPLQGQTRSTSVVPAALSTTSQQVLSSVGSVRNMAALRVSHNRSSCLQDVH